MDFSASEGGRSAPEWGDIARCLVPLLDSIGWRGEQSQLIAALPHLPNEMGVEELLNTMANLRFEGRIVPMRANQIDPRLLPCLFVPDFGPARILLARGDGQDLAFDGKSGEYRQTPISNEKGRAIVFRAMREGEGGILLPQPNWFGRVFRRFGPVLLQGGLLTVVLTLFAVAAPGFVMAIYDKVLTSGSIETLHTIGIGAVLFIIADAGFRFLRSRLFRFVSVRLGNIIGNEVLRRILYLPPAFSESAPIGSQISRIKDFETVREFFAGQAVIALFDLPFIVLLIGVLFALGGVIGWVPIGAIALFCVFGVFMMPIVRRSNAATAQAVSDRQAFLVEMLTNIEPLKWAAVTSTWVERYRKLSADAAMENFRANVINGLVNAFSHVFLMGAGLSAMVLGVFQAKSGNISLGALMASMILVWRILAPLRTGFGILTQFGRIRRSIAQVDRLMGMRLENLHETTLTNFTGIKGRIEFNNVAIRYSPDLAPALVGVNLKIEPGEVLQILGHDGAGKSTVLKLILGLYAPQVGRILVDNVNVRQFDMGAYRRSIGYAPQDGRLFYGSIAQNLRLAHADASDEDLKDAARRANLLEDIENLDEGFDTRIGHHKAGRLSDSFQRRLNIARVFVSRPKLIILDEPETGLSHAELDDFAESTEEWKGDATIIIASNQSLFMPLADKVLWLEKGRVRAFGPASEVFPAYERELAA
jgi:ATP-binding cassette, subfamily C, bacterial LapB